MPIVVDHNGQAVAAILQALLAGQQQQAPPQHQQDDLLRQIRDVAEKSGGKGKGGKQVDQSAADDDDGGSSKPPGYNTGHGGSPAAIPKYQSSQPRRSGGDVFRWLQLLLDQNQSSDRLNQQAGLAQFSAQEQAARQASSQQHQDEAEQTRHANTVAEHYSRPVPQWIQKGLSDGSLTYSPAQKRDRQDKLDALNKAHSDPSWSPAHVAQLEADLRPKINQIDLSPQPVPPDERPVSPQEQANKSSWTETDPQSGLTVRWHAGGMRNGVQQPPQLDEISKTHLKDWEDAQKEQRKLQSKQAEAAMKPENVSPAQKYDAQQQAAYVEAHRKRALEALGPRPKPGDREFQEDVIDPDLKTPTGKKELNDEKYQHALIDWQAKAQAINDHYSPEDQFAQHMARGEQNLQDIGAAAGGMSMLPLPGGPTTSMPTYDDGSGGVADDQSGDDQSGDGEPDPDQSTGPDPLHHDPDIGRSQWDGLEHGAVTSLPDGRLVQKTGPDSYAPYAPVQ